MPDSLEYVIGFWKDLLITAMQYYRTMLRTSLSNNSVRGPRGYNP